MDEVLIANFMIFQDAVDAGRLRSRDRRRGLGHRPLLARASGAEEGEARLVHRLRRLRADAVGRRARGVPDHRLQCRDDRAYRAASRRARPRDLRRHARGHRAAVLRQGSAGDARLGAEAFRFRRLHHRRASADVRQPRGAAPAPRLPRRRARLHRHRRRLGRRRASDPAHPAELSDGAGPGCRSCA